MIMAGMPLLVKLISQVVRWINLIIIDVDLATSVHRVIITVSSNTGCKKTVYNYLCWLQLITSN